MENTNINSLRDSAAKAFPLASWFGLGIDIYKLANLFPNEKPIAKPGNEEVVKKLEALMDPDEVWPYDVSTVQHATNDAYVNAEIEKADKEKNSEKFLRFYRKYILHSVEDAIAMLCVKVLAIMGRYNKTTGDPAPEYRDEYRETEFLDVFKESSDRDICDFLRRKIRDIFRRECDTKERNRESDFHYILSFLFSFAVRLGIKNIEWYIQKRINFELLRAAEKIVKKKRTKRPRKNVV